MSLYRCRFFRFLDRTRDAFQIQGLACENYAAVLARSKFAFPPDEIAAVLTMFRSPGELFRPDVSAAVSSDPADTKFLH